MRKTKSSNEELFSITQLAKEFDISTRTIRFYEAKELLSPERVGTTRIFRRRDRGRLILILRGKRLGFSLREIADYLSLYEVDNGQTTQMSKLIELVDERAAVLTRQMSDLETTLEELKEIKDLAREQLRSLQK